MKEGQVTCMNKPERSDIHEHLAHTLMGCRAFGATGSSDYHLPLTDGGRIEVGQCMTGYSNAKTMGLNDRRNDDLSVGDVERIRI